MKSATRPDAVTLVLTNQNIDLQRQVTDLRRDLEAARKENEMLWKAMNRPSVASMTEEQVHVIAELLYSNIMGFAVTKEPKQAS